MKRLLLLALSLGAATMLSAQVFVNAAAGGANDGTSWTDAYTDLGTALQNTTSGDIWVAAGTYTPGADSTASFVIGGAVNLYGGFAGTETMLSERDFSANVTTLSGDNSGDDTDDDFVTNKSDNARHVVTADSLISGAAVIDGFTISYGANNALGGAALEISSGGGILAFSTVEVRNCSFSQNFAGVGAAVAVLGPPTAGSGIVSTNSIVEESTFSGNASSDWGLIHFFAADNGTVSSCEFTGNANVRGAVHARFCLNTTVDNISVADNVSGATNAGVYFWQCLGTIVSDSEFSENTSGVGTGIWADFRGILDPVAEGQGLLMDNVEMTANTVTPGGFAGAGIFWQPNGVKIENSEFSGNEGDTGPGAFYIDNRDITDQDTTRFIVDNCLFEGNSAPGASSVGGAWWGSGLRGVIRNSTFEGNTSTSVGGALYFTVDDVTHYVYDCTFEGNSAPFGGAIGTFTDGAYFNTEFNENVGDGSQGGAMLVGFTGEVSIDGSSFTENQANAGGAIWVQNDSSALTVTNSTFTANQAVGSSSGGIFTNGGIPLVVDNCEFSQNSAVFFGGAINAIEDSLDINTVQITNSNFFLNTALQGGAINLGNAEGDLINNLMFNNSAIPDDDGGGAGGAVSVNISGVNDNTVSMINNTMGNNSGAIGANVGAFQDSTAVATINMQNNLLIGPSNGEANVAIEDGMPDIVDVGGNLLAGGGNMGLETIFTTSTITTDPVGDIVTSAAIGDYTLIAGSPAIDIGVASGAPSTDIDGNPRPDPVSGLVDAGAYEFQPNSVREEVVDDASQLILLPNPVRENLYLQMNNDWTGELHIRVMNLNGQEVRSLEVEKFGQVQTYQVNLNGLPAAQYEVLVTNGSQVLVRQAIKQ